MTTADEMAAVSELAIREMYADTVRRLLLEIKETAEAGGWKLAWTYDFNSDHQWQHPQYVNYQYIIEYHPWLIAEHGFECQHGWSPSYGSTFYSIKWSNK